MLAQTIPRKIHSHFLLLQVALTGKASHNLLRRYLPQYLLAVTLILKMCILWQDIKWSAVVLVCKRENVHTIFL